MAATGVDDPQRSIAIANFIHDNAHRLYVVDLVKIPLFASSYARY